MNKLPLDSNRLLLVDDDPTFGQVLAAAFAKRGYEVDVAPSPAEALSKARQRTPHYAVVDLNMPGGSGLGVVEQLHALSPSTRIVVLTGYASVATAVEAIKLGATHYLTKPADISDIIAAFEKDAGDASAEIAPKPMSVNRMEWEYVQKVLKDHDGNISAAARALSMHRRTLQRKLRKYPVKQ